MINKILVATDASAASGRAVSFAAQLAVIHEAELLILNVIRDMQLPDELKNAPEFESFNNTRDDLMRQAADRILDEARKKAKKAGAKKVQTAIGSGDPATSVAGFAKRRKVDLIVVGTRGLSKIKAASMGSVSRKLLDLTDVNCAVIR
ncbi:MAG: universal stress protein [Gammaproteobacteria bacterium]|jgi:nucleotide-binding universal stress UspA family protein|nr:universal stress protein [Gammaproteobacteria bacterium]